MCQVFACEYFFRHFNDPFTIALGGELLVWKVCLLASDVACVAGGFVRTSESGEAARRLGRGN